MADYLYDPDSSLDDFAYWCRMAVKSYPDFAKVDHCLKVARAEVTGLRRVSILRETLRLKWVPNADNSGARRLVPGARAVVAANLLFVGDFYLWAELVAGSASPWELEAWAARAHCWRECFKMSREGGEHG